MSDGAERQAVLVLGMHRSGTSALTRLLGDLGLALPADGIGAHADNPRGYWEPQALVRVDDRILRTARTSWFDPRPFDLAAIPADVAAAHRADLAAAIAESFGAAPAIAIKDPRLCRLVPLLRDALGEAGYACQAVLMLRDPHAIARSLHARDRSTPGYALALWLRHMIDAERDTRDLPRIAIDYDAMIDDPAATAARLAAFVGRDDTGADAVDPTLRRNHSAEHAALDPRLAAIVAEAHAALLALADRDDRAARDRIDAVAHAWDGDPRLRDDIIHDELRHRRFEELRLRAAHPEPEPEPMPASPLPPPPEPRDAPDDEVALVRHSGLFDADWYRERYPDAAASGLDPVVHYLTIGAALGHDPNPLFRTAYYARQMIRRDMLAAKGNGA